MVQVLFSIIQVNLDFLNWVLFRSKFVVPKYCDSDNESTHIHVGGGIVLLLECNSYMSYPLLFKCSFTHNGLKLHSWKGKADSVYQQHVLKVYSRMKIKLHTFLTSMLDWVVSSQSRSGCGDEDRSPSPDGNQIPHFQSIKTYIICLLTTDGHICFPVTRHIR